MLAACVAEDIRNVLDTDLPWDRFAGKNVLVTGAAGFLPAYFVETLLALKDRGSAPKGVVGLVRNRGKAEARFKHHRAREDFTLVESDLSGPLPESGAFDYVIHAASQASPRYYLTDPVGTLTPNVIGTYNLLEKARRDGTEGFLFLSSGEVYGQPTGPGLIAETDYGHMEPASVRSCYGESKRMGETMCVSAHHQYSVPTYIGRPFHTYGPGLAADDGRVFADFVADIVAGRNLTIKGDGTARRAFCYASDAIIGLFTIMLKGQPARPYNVGNDTACVSIRELAEILVDAFPERALEVILDSSKASATYAKSPIASNCPNVSALRRLGWKPRVDIAEGFRRTVASIEEAGTR